MYKLEFLDDEEGRRNYELSFQAIALHDKSPQLSEWDDVIGLLRKMKSIGHPATEKIGKTQLFDLNAGGGSIDLERSEYKMLAGMLERPIWRPMALEDVQLVKAWIESLKDNHGSLRLDARPEAKRRADNG